MRVLLAANATKRTQLFRAFDQLIIDPLRKGQYEELDVEGRAVQILVLPAWTVTYWTDFFSKEIRIVRIEPNRDIRKRR
jgi:hypothetical protein